MAIKRSPAKRAAQAHSDLNCFATVVTILEGGHLYCSESQPTARKIIRLCQSEQQKLLRRYDAAVAEADQQ